MLEQNYSKPVLKAKKTENDYFSRTENIEGTPEFFALLEKSVREVKAGKFYTSEQMAENIKNMIAKHKNKSLN